MAQAQANYVTSPSSIAVLSNPCGCNWKIVFFGLQVTCNQHCRYRHEFFVVTWLCVGWIFGMPLWKRGMILDEIALTMDRYLTAWSTDNAIFELIGFRNIKDSNNVAIWLIFTIMFMFWEIAILIAVVQMDQYKLVS